MSKIKNYILDHIKTDDAIIKRIEEAHRTRQDIQPSIGEEAGRFLSLMIHTLNAKRVLELGTCLGYAAIYMGEALKSTGGLLITVEKNTDLADEAALNIAESGLSDYISIIPGDARHIIGDLEGLFDLILQDSDKSLYPDFLENCIKLTRPGGLIIADDALFKPMDLPEKFSDPVNRYVELAFNDPRLYSTLLPVGDGLLVSTKI